MTSDPEVCAECGELKSDHREADRACPIVVGKCWFTASRFRACEPGEKPPDKLD